jgi:hypothetical protein
LLRFARNDDRFVTAFYEQALAPLGIKKLMAFEGGTRFGRDAPGLWISASSEPRSSVHLALSGPDKSAVRAFHNAALSAGAKDNGAPGPHDFAANYMPPWSSTPTATTLMRSATAPRPGLARGLVPASSGVTYSSLRSLLPP